MQLADRSIRYPEGVLPDVPIQVGDLWIFVDFVVIDMEEDDKILIILGHPFLATYNAVIDVKNRKISLLVGDDKTKFDIKRSMNYPAEADQAYGRKFLEENEALKITYARMRT